jgi:alpha-N-arabinofuranosidase
VDLNAKNLAVTTQVLLISVLLFSIAASAQDQLVAATIDTSKTSTPISKYIYGQFLEHIGGIVNNNIWAEMLDDRKFYFPINSHPPAEPSGPAWRRVTLRHWTPIGADEFVTMDTDHPYTGDHTPRVKLSSSEAHGIQQGGLAVRKGKSYTGRVVLAGTSGTTVKVSLIWGNAASCL